MNDSEQFGDSLLLPSHVVGNTITIHPRNGLCVGTTSAGGVWIALLGAAGTALEISELINRLFREEAR